MKKIRHYDDLSIHKDRAKIALDKGEYAEARHELREALRFAPNDAMLHYELGIVLGSLRKRTLAVNEFRTALGLLPRNDRFLANRTLNAMEFIQGKTVLRSKPRCLWITITDACNLTCIMCGVKGKGDELTDRAARMIKKYMPYLEEIHWQGGEVFLSRNFEALYDEALKYPYLKQNINTNGTLIDDRWARKLARNNVSLTIAIDGITKTTYEKIRVGADFDRLRKNIETLNGYKAANNALSAPGDKMKTIMSFIVMKSNYRELPGTVEFARAHSFEALQIYPIDSTFDNENIFIHDNRDILTEISKTMRSVAVQSNEYGIQLMSKLPSDSTDTGRRAGEQAEHAPKRYLCGLVGEGACDIPWRHFAVDMRGLVRPSCSCSRTAGSLSSKSIDALWNNDVMKAYRRRVYAMNSKKSGGLCEYSCEYEKRDDKSKLLFERIKSDIMRSGATAVEKKRHVRELLKFLRGRPDHLNALRLLARFYFREKNNAGSYERYRQALRISPDDGEMSYELGICCRALERYDESIEAFLNALRLGFEENACRLELASSYCNKSMYGEALREYRRVCAWRTDRPDIKTRMEEIRRSLDDIRLGMGNMHE